MFVKSPARDRQLVSLEIWSKQRTLPFWGVFFFFLLVSENPLLVFLPEWQVMCLWGDTSPSFVSLQQGG